MRLPTITLIAAALSLPLAAFAAPIGAEDKANVEAALTKAGYTSWGEISFDDDLDLYLIKDATGPNCNKCEIKMDTKYMVSK